MAVKRQIYFLWWESIKWADAKVKDAVSVQMLSLRELCHHSKTDGLINKTYVWRGIMVWNTYRNKQLKCFNSNISSLIWDILQDDINTMYVYMGVNGVEVFTGWNILPCCCYGHLGDATSCLPHWCCLATVAPLCQSHGWFLKWGFHLLALNEQRKSKQGGMVSRESHSSLREDVCKKFKPINCININQVLSHT